MLDTCGSVCSDQARPKISIDFCTGPLTSPEDSGSKNVTIVPALAGSSANWTQSTEKLEITLGEDFQNNTVYVVEYEVTNPKEWGSRGACVSVDRVQRGDLLLKAALMGDISVLTPRIDYATSQLIATTSATTCGSSCGLRVLTATLFTNFPLLVRCSPRITVAGLSTLSSTASNSELPLNAGAAVDETGFRPANSSQWDKSAGTLVVALVNPANILTLNSLNMFKTNFTFQLKNPQDVNMADTRYEMSIFFADSKVDAVAKKSAAACKRPMFVQTSNITVTATVVDSAGVGIVSDSSGLPTNKAYPCVSNNRMQIVLKPDIDIEICDGSCDMVAITGLTGMTVANIATALTSSPDVISRDSTDGPTFDNATGTLTFKLTAKLSANTNYIVWLLVTNSHKIQAAPRLGITISCHSVFVGMPAGMEIIHAFRADVAHVLPCVGHSTNSPGALNRVSLQLHLSGPLVHACTPKIMIEGLNGAQSCGAGAQATVLKKDTASTNSDMFLFDQVAVGGPLRQGSVQQLTLATSADVGAGDYTLFFNVSNACSKQQGSSAISAWVVYSADSGTASTPAEQALARSHRMALSVCQNAPLSPAANAKPLRTHAPSLIITALTSSSADAGAANSISVEFMANFALKPGMSMVIQGLVDVTGQPMVTAGNIVAQLDSVKGVLTLTATAAVAESTTATTWSVTTKNKPAGSGAVRILLSMTGYSCGCAGTAQGNAVSTIGPFEPAAGFDFMNSSFIRTGGYDLDADGIWSESEFTAFATDSGNGGVPFNTVDTDGDGVLNKTEYEAAVAPGGGGGLTAPNVTDGDTGVCSVDCTDFVPSFGVILTLDIVCSTVAYSEDPKAVLNEMVGCTSPCTSTYVKTGTNYKWTFSSSPIRCAFINPA